MIYTVLLVIGSYILAIFPAGWLINRLLKRFDVGEIEEGGLKKAGKHIGYLERFLNCNLCMVGRTFSHWFTYSSKVYIPLWRNKGQTR